MAARPSARSSPPRLPETLRGVDYLTYWNNTPAWSGRCHLDRVPGPRRPGLLQRFGHPRRDQDRVFRRRRHHWPIVPTGTYRIVTTSPDTQFASFWRPACKPGRVINANPPWGAYELSPGEKPLGASNAGRQARFGQGCPQEQDQASALLVLNSGENIDATVTLAAGGMTTLRTLPLKPGNKTLTSTSAQSQGEAGEGHPSS